MSRSAPSVRQPREALPLHAISHITNDVDVPVTMIREPLKEDVREVTVRLPPLLAPIAVVQERGLCCILHSMRVTMS